MARQHIFSGASWEAIAGYARALRVGNMVYVAGTTAVDEQGAVVAPGDAYAQTRHVLRIIERALREAGAELSDVVRTRMFVTDISRWQEVTRAHGEVFNSISPVATLVQVAALIDPALLIEIEVDAVRE